MADVEWSRQVWDFVRDLDWGNVPTWLGLTATTLSLGFAGRQVALNTRQRADEAKRAAAESERDRRRHAQLVHVVGVWAEVSSGRQKVKVTVTNSGDQPVIYATPQFTIPAGYSSAGEQRVSGTRRVEARGKEEWVEFLGVLVTEAPAGSVLPPLRVSLVFQDAEGGWWIRGDNGSLQSTDAPAPITR